MLSHTEDHDEGPTCGPLPHATPTPVISTSCPINDAMKKAKKTREFPLANTHMWAFELPCRAATLGGSLLGWWGRRVRGWWLSQWDWRSWERRIGRPLLLLDLLRDGLVSLRVQVQNLVANVWKTETDFFVERRWNTGGKAGRDTASSEVPSSSSTGTSWTNCSHQRRDDCLAVHSWMSNLQRRPAKYMTATAIISGSHCRDSMVHRLPGTQSGYNHLSVKNTDCFQFCPIIFYYLCVALEQWLLANLGWLQAKKGSGCIWFGEVVFM